MKVKTLLAFILTNAFLMLSAQEGKFGYIDFNGTLRIMPEYLEAENNLRQIQSDYHEEIERSKREFERQYIEFMLEQDHLSASIVAKRQKELQLLMDNNAQFRDNVQLELEARRDELLMPLKKKLMKVVSDVCIEKNLDYVVDTGKGTYLYINQEKGVDITDDVYKILGIERKVETVVEGGQPVLINDQNNKQKE
ncbi:MAG: OmpH family outer membrane protein [Bacteroidaceae bacterium]|nr:OmpH family outer membrane protein [Bacteroidaceae bacterium]MBR5707500.1 OmpH family outer membrane protein [Bacteroidaceae bacterium]